MLRVQVVTVRRQQGVGKASGKAYNFQSVGVLMPTANGTEYCDLSLDGEAPVPEVGKYYVVEMAFYPDREKKLMHRVMALQPLPASKAA